ncbi:MAG TPA: hypothetical protein VK870_16550 [Ignavibacteriaceae bacterium]|jgi:hypothetical protein|nr:hypothetical protein [Ignavibacteriaceae bacterium]
MSTQFDKQTFENNFRVTYLIFFALAAGQLLILVMFLFLINGVEIQDDNPIDNIFTFIVPLVGLTTMFASKILYTQNILKIQQTDTITEKLMKYRSFKIISWAILEGAALFSLVAFFLTANYLYVAVFIFVYGFFLFIRPSKEGFVMDMQISGPVKETILRT